MYRRPLWIGIASTIFYFAELLITETRKVKKREMPLSVHLPSNRSTESVKMEVNAAAQKVFKCKASRHFLYLCSVEKKKTWAGFISQNDVFSLFSFCIIIVTLDNFFFFSNIYALKLVSNLYSCILSTFLRANNELLKPHKQQNNCKYKLFPVFLEYSCNVNSWGERSEPNRCFSQQCLEIFNSSVSSWEKMFTNLGSWWDMDSKEFNKIQKPLLIFGKCMLQSRK